MEKVMWVQLPTLFILALLGSAATAMTGHLLNASCKREVRDGKEVREAAQNGRAG